MARRALLLVALALLAAGGTATGPHGPVVVTDGALPEQKWGFSDLFRAASSAASSAHSAIGSAVQSVTSSGAVAAVQSAASSAASKASEVAGQAWSSAKGLAASAVDFADALANKGFLETLRSGRYCQKLKGALQSTSARSREQLARALALLPVDPSADPKACIAMINETLTRETIKSLGKQLFGVEAMHNATLLIIERTSAVLCRRGDDGIANLLSSSSAIRSSEPAVYVSSLTARLGETLQPLFDKYTERLCNDAANTTAAFSVFGAPLLTSGEEQPGSAMALLAMGALVAGAAVAVRRAARSRAAAEVDLEVAE